MKYWGFLALLLAVFAIWYVLYKPTEGFRSEILDTGNTKRTTETSQSSYNQETNHFPKVPSDLGQISGYETPFRVNMYNAFIE